MVVRYKGLVSSLVQAELFSDSCFQDWACSTRIRSLYTKISLWPVVHFGTTNIQFKGVCATQFGCQLRGWLAS